MKPREYGEHESAGCRRQTENGCRSHESNRLAKGAPARADAVPRAGHAVSALYMRGEERRCDLHVGARAMDNRVFSVLSNYVVKPERRAPARMRARMRAQRPLGAPVEAANAGERAVDFETPTGHAACVGQQTRAIGAAITRSIHEVIQIAFRGPYGAR